LRTGENGEKEQEIAGKKLKVLHEGKNSAFWEREGEKEM